MEMNIQESALNITGNVTIKVKKGDAVIKTTKQNNMVTIQFLLGLARFVRGDFKGFVDASSDFIPLYLGVGLGTDLNNDRNRFKLVNELPVITRFDAVGNKIEIKESKFVSLTISSYVPSSIVGGLELKEFGLFYTRTPDSPTLLARVEDIDATRLADDESLQIDWVFNFGNDADLNEGVI